MSPNEGWRIGKASFVKVIQYIYTINKQYFIFISSYIKSNIMSYEFFLVCYHGCFEEMEESFTLKSSFSKVFSAPTADFHLPHNPDG